MSTTPIVLVGGFAYRLDPAGKLEHTRASLALVGDANWIAITEATTAAVRAAAALAVLQGSVKVMDGMPLGTAFRLSTGKDDAAAADRRRTEQARDVQRINAKHDKGPDASAVAAEKGLKIWNGGGYGVIRTRDAIAHGHRDSSGVHVYACAKSRAELFRMVAAYNGVEKISDLQVGTQTNISLRWSHGAWGVNMAGIEPEPGIWLQWKDADKPVRVWPKESAK